MTHDESQQEKKPPKWDRTEAADSMGDAMASGDTDALKQSAHRLGDAIVNDAMARYAEGMLKQVGVVVRHEIQGLQGKFDFLTNEINAEAKRGAAARDKTNEVEGELLTALKEVRSEVGKFGVQLADAVSRIDTLEERADQTEAREVTRDGRILAVEQRLNATEERLAVVELAQASLQREHQRLLSHFNRDKLILKSISEETDGGP